MGQPKGQVEGGFLQGCKTYTLQMNLKKEKPDTKNIINQTTKKSPIAQPCDCLLYEG